MARSSQSAKRSRNSENHSAGTAITPAPGLHRFSQMERVYWGRSILDVLPEELAIIGACRVFIVTNRTLANTALLATIVALLEHRYVGCYAQVTAHAPRECAIAGAAAARETDADLLLAVGGGSVIDAAKAMLMCLRHGYTSADQLDRHANVRIPDLGYAPSDAELWRRVIAVPTTLSAAEFASSAGLTDPTRGLKQAFSHPMQMPQAVILDPAMTMPTPLPLLKATGMKAVDHAAERMTSATANLYSDAVSELALRLLGEALMQIEGRPEDLGLRSKLQYGMFMSMCGAAAGVAVNVSHALGHVLGGHSGVPHGQTTGLILPAVLRWNKAVTVEAQTRIAAALDGPPGDGAAAISILVETLSLPTRLRDVGISNDEIPELARKAMHESLLANSRIPVKRADQLETILQSAW
jgi:maleylacetate reductase